MTLCGLLGLLLETQSTFKAVLSAGKKFSVLIFHLCYMRQWSTTTIHSNTISHHLPICEASGGDKPICYVILQTSSENKMQWLAKVIRGAHEGPMKSHLIAISLLKSFFQHPLCQPHFFLFPASHPLAPSPALYRALSLSLSRLPCSPHNCVFLFIASHFPRAPPFRILGTLSQLLVSMVALPRETLFSPTL